MIKRIILGVIFGALILQGCTEAEKNEIFIEDKRETDLKEPNEERDSRVNKEEMTLEGEETEGGEVTEEERGEARLGKESEVRTADSERKVYPEKGTIPIYHGEAYSGTIEKKYKEHEEILENPITKENISYSVKKAVADSPYYNNEKPETSTFWVPQLTGMEDIEKQNRLNQLIIDESQEWLYQDWSLSNRKTDLYMEYCSDKYFSYCYQIHDVHLGMGRDGELEIYITIDLEEEKRVKLEDLLDWNNETFIVGFSEICLGGDTQKDLEWAAAILENANTTFTELWNQLIIEYDGEENILSFSGYMATKPSFYLRPSRVIIETTPYWGDSDVTIELPVFEEFLKVEPWQ